MIKMAHEKRPKVLKVEKEEEEKEFLVKKVPFW